ncbi:MAG: aminotransferase class I/II-fold pyridoxal phosphate-dependent enzyme [Deltaproteobacteria bacterium]|nr:aminotransferase class I/II-fold pyridoxal phosphate-dependent enzyme [Deltaproteobacteria bacterium]
MKDALADLRLAFVGAGQIGGSLLLRARQVFPNAKIAVSDPAIAPLQNAAVADVVSADWAAIVGDAEIIVIAAPLAAAIELAPKILAATSGVVLDVGSVKTPLHTAAAFHPRFVGGHPMFGSEGQGFGVANAALVVDAPFVLTTTPETAAASRDLADAFVRGLGAVPVHRSPEEHDAEIARVSHLPQLAAWALALAVGSDPHVTELSGPGLRDTTRLAASPPEMWAPLFVANAVNVSDAVDALIAALARIKDAIDDAPRLQKDLALARTTKRSWPLVRAGRLADRVNESQTGAMLSEIVRRRAAGEHIAPLHVGEPRLPLSPAIEAIVREALAAAPIAYTETKGTLELRAQVAKIASRVTGVAHTADEAIVTSGAKQALHLALASILAPGDEVLVAQPAWVSFAELVRLAGGRPVPVETQRDAGLDPDAFAAALTSHTRAAILNTPNNPTGAVYSAAALDAVLALFARYDLWLISDELYRAFVFQGAHVSPLSRYPIARDRGVFIDGIAKSHAMTGLRVGWATGPRGVIDRMVRLASHETSCASSVSQHTALALLERFPDGDSGLVAAVAARRATVLASGLKSGPMQGAFYAWIDLGGRSSREVAAALLSAGVATMPGAAFGREGFLRVAYAVDDTTLAEALEIVREGTI